MLVGVRVGLPNRGAAFSSGDRSSFMASLRLTLLGSVNGVSAYCRRENLAQVLDVYRHRCDIGYRIPGLGRGGRSAKPGKGGTR